MRWQGGEGGRVVRLEGGGFQGFFKGGECRVTPRFHLFVSDVNQEKDCRNGKTLLYLLRDVKYMLGHGNVWNL